MRYPLWAFFFVLVMPTFAAHALLTGRAHIAANQPDIQISQTVPQYWSHITIVR